MKHLQHLAAIVAMLLCCTTASAYSFKVDGIFYNIKSSSALTVEVTYENSNYNSYSGDVVIPATVTYKEKVYTVTSIGREAFFGCSSLTSIILPEGVTSIGIFAFDGCSSLTSITIPEGLTSIRNSAFRNCSSLTSITIPESVTSIDSEAFSGCSSLTSIVLPEGLTSIGDEAFVGCSSLTSIVLPEGVTSIGDYVFSGCSSLTSITIPEGVTSIGTYAFSGCSSLTSITFPESMTSIGGLGGNAFQNCSRLTEIHIASIEAWLKISYSDTYSHPCYYASNVKLFVDGEELTEVEVPSSVTSIPSNAFRNCSSLTSITLPEGVTSIGSFAFRNCSSLTSITLPESVISIGISSFDGCSRLRSVVLKSTTPPAMKASSYIPDIIVFAVPATSYNDYVSAAYWSDLVSQITIESARMKNVALTAKDNKSDLQVNIGDENLKYVTDLTISGSINSYDFLVMRTKMPLLRHLDLSDATIVYNAHEHYAGYHTEDNKFPGYGLYGCNLLSLVLPKNITAIGYNAMRKNDNLSEVTFFEGLISIETDAFAGCNVSSVVLPKGLTSLAQGVFYYCRNLTSVTLPEGFTTLGLGVFEGCEKLSEIELPKGLTTIGTKAFSGCTSLNEVVLPPTVKEIKGSAFVNCDRLTEVRIPGSVRLIGDGAFSGCDMLKDVYVYTVEPVNIGQDTFAKDRNNENKFIGTLHAPRVSYWEYYYDTQWSQFTSFVEFDEPYENFYLVGDKVLDDKTGAIKGEGDKNPDAEMGNNSGIIVEGDVTQDLGDVDIEHDGENGGSIIVGGEGCVNADELHFHINVQGGRWYFFCFPFDVRREDIVLQNGAEWVFRYYDGEERAKNGKGGWKNVTSDGNGNHLKAATGYIFQCSKDDVLILTAKNQKIKQEKKYNELVEHITQNAHDASWNFVGNPYLSYYEVTSDDYSAPITVWDGSKYIAIRPGDDDYQLAPFEAFFVQKPEGVANVDYSPERQHTYHGAQEAAAKARARRRAIPVNPARLLVNITLSNGTDTDQTRVVFNNEAALGYEATCDAAKFSTAGMPQLYTVDSRAVKYAINERPAEEGIVTMGYTAPAEGNYTLAAPRMDTPIVVKDNLTGTIHDFSDGDYTFMTQAGTFEDRFTVMTKAGTTGIDRLESTDNSQQPIYDAAGRRVEKMEQGIYIKENRKVVRL